METYFQPVSKHAAAHAEILAPHTLGKKVIQHTVQNGFPDLSHVKIAFFVVAESRNACNYKGVSPDFEATRMAFYTLYPGHWSHTIADLGNLKLGATVADTYAAVQTVVQELIEQHIIPIILGGSQDIIYGQYRACQRTHQYLNIVNIGDLALFHQGTKNVESIMGVYSFLYGWQYIALYNITTKI